MATTTPDLTQTLFVTGLQNAHGVEHQALALIDRQLDHLENYPEVSEMLRKHRGETEAQIARIDGLLDGLNESASKLKDVALGLTGNLAAIMHMPAPDEILKNSFANYAFENFEIACYTSLITLAEAGDFSNATSVLNQSLDEEQRMAAWVIESLPGLTRKYVGLRASVETASA